MVIVSGEGAYLGIVSEGFGRSLYLNPLAHYGQAHVIRGYILSQSNVIRGYITH